MRQKENKLFAKLLNRLREGKHSEADIDILKQRLVTSMSKKNSARLRLIRLLWLGWLYGKEILTK